MKQWLWSAEISEAGSLASGGENYAVWLTPQSSFWDQGKATLSSFQWAHLWRLILRVNLTDIQGTQIFLLLSVQSLSRVWLSAAPWTAAHQASLFLPSPGACSNSCPLSWWCHPITLSSVIPFCLQSFPASGSSLMSWLFTSGGQTTGTSASASVLPMTIQDWFPLGWTGWISLQSKGLSRIVSNTTTQKHQFFDARLYGPTLTYIWLNIILGVSVRIYPGEIRIWIDREKQMPSPMWVGLIQSVEELSRTEEGRQRDREGKFHFCQIAPAGPSVFSCLRTGPYALFPDIWTSTRTYATHPPGSQVLWLQLAFLDSSLQAADGGNFSFHNHESMIWGLPCWLSGWESALWCKVQSLFWQDPICCRTAKPSCLSLSPGL